MYQYWRIESQFDDFHIIKYIVIILTSQNIIWYLHVKKGYIELKRGDRYQLRENERLKMYEEKILQMFVKFVMSTILILREKINRVT